MQISRFCGYSRKFSPRSLGAWHPLWCGTSKQPVKVFSAKTVLFTNSRKFSLRKSYFSPIRESFLCENRTFHQFVKVFSFESFLLYGIPGCYNAIAYRSRVRELSTIVPELRGTNCSQISPHHLVPNPIKIINCHCTSW